MVLEFILGRELVEREYKLCDYKYRILIINIVQQQFCEILLKRVSYKIY